MIFLWRKLVVNHEKGRDMNIKKKLIGAAVTIVGALGFVSCGTTKELATYEVVTEDGRIITVSQAEYEKLMKERQFREEQEARKAREAYERALRERENIPPPPLVYGPPPTF